MAGGFESQGDAEVMKEKPILFCGPMVRAILDGNKTMTRRLMKPQPVNPVGPNYDGLWSDTKDPVTRYFSPPCLTGQILYVKETFLPKAFGTIYRADYDSAEAAGIGAMYGGWKPSIFMPRAKSRLRLQVYTVRVERLRDISEEDAKAEGIDRHYSEQYPERMWWKSYNGDDIAFKSPVNSFKSLWESIHGKGSWSINPWVWVVSFKKI